MREEEKKRTRKKTLSLILICALIIGILPMGRASVNKAEEVSASAKEASVLATGASTSAEGASVSAGAVSPSEGTSHELSNPTWNEDDTVATWDCVYFGYYWQSDTNRDGAVDKKDAKEAIKWRVLSVDGDNAFLLADKNLDVQRYNDTNTDVTWETCTMRSWLNGYGDYSGNNFLDNAFNESEQAAITKTTVINEDNPNPEYPTEGGEDTEDNVYLLSISEVTNPSYGFQLPSSSTSVSKTREAVSTAYVSAGGEIQSYMYSAGAGGSDPRDGWWLRSPGCLSFTASSVTISGYVDQDGKNVNNRDRAVRPALHLNLSSDSSWSYAGTVTSDGKGIEEITPPSPRPVVTPPPATPTPSPSIEPTRTPAISESGIVLPTTSDGVTTWDCVYFGNYWQSDTNKNGVVDKDDAKEPIKWRVLFVDGDDAFLLADKNLDVQRYDIMNANVTWETCTMRSWLNGYGIDANKCGVNYSDNNFLDAAFTEAEQEAIKSTTVVNEDNPEYGTKGGKNTEDKVYLLSIGEAMTPAYGFTPTTNSTDTRQAVNTAYVVARGEINSIHMSRAGLADYWWLRSPGFNSYNVSNVGADGSVYRDGGSADSDIYAVRPALHLDLSFTSSWSYAGTVTSNEKSGTVPTAPQSPPPLVKPTQTPGTSGAGGIAPASPQTSTQIVQPQTTEESEVTPESAVSEVVTPVASGKVTGLKLMAKKKALQTSWKKVSGASGYELWYSTSKKFAKKKSKTVKKTKLTIKNLKQKKVYFIKVRAYMMKDGKKVYGAWSKTVKKKVR